MEPTDLTIEILKGIRDEARKTNEAVHETNERIDQTNARLDQTNAGLDRTNARLEGLRADLVRRQTETEVRLATEIVGVAGAVREVRDLLRDDFALRRRVDDHERRLAALEKRTG